MVLVVLGVHVGLVIRVGLTVYVSLMVRSGESLVDDNATSGLHSRTSQAPMKINKD